MKKPIIAAQLYTLRDLLNGKNEAEIRQVLTEVKDIGYTAVQISGVGEVTPALAETYRSICQELDLDICATHFNLDYMEKNLEWVVDIHKLWRCDYAGVGSMPESMRDEASLMPFINRMNLLGQQLKEVGIQLVYHNHRFEFEQSEGKPWLQIMLEGFDPEVVQFELDTYWVQAGGANPVTWINKVAGNMGIMHLKDMSIVDNEQLFAEIGQGNLEWPAIMEAAVKAEVTYAAVEQDSDTEDPMASLKISYDFLQGLL